MPNPSAKVSERDPFAHILPDLAEWDVICAEVAYAYVRDAIKRGAQTGAAEINITPSFSVDNPAVVEWLRNYTIRLAGNVNRTTINALRDALVEGIDAGEALPSLRKRVQGVMGDEANRYRAGMIARTETGRAQNAGREQQLKEAGAVRKVWAAMADACAWCQSLDGRTIEIDQQFFHRGDSLDIGDVESPKVMHLDYSDTPHPPLHPNCLLPGTRCETPCGVIAGLRAVYHGPVIELGFEAGTRLTVTANHMLLSRTGYIPARLLAEGQEVVYCPTCERVVSRNPDHDDHPPRIEDVFNTLAESGGMSTCQVPVAAEYLHGDGRLCDGYIDIVAPDRLLRDAGEAMFLEEFHKPAFCRTDTELSEFSGTSDPAAMLFRLASAAHGMVRRSAQTASLSGAGLCHSGKHAFVPVSRGNSLQVQPASDDIAAHAELFGKLLDRYSSVVTLQPIISLRTLDYSGHVYDLQTLSSLYIANGAITSNCRCITQYQFEGE